MNSEQSTVSSQLFSVYCLLITARIIPKILRVGKRRAGRLTLAQSKNRIWDRRRHTLCSPSRRRHARHPHVERRAFLGNILYKKIPHVTYAALAVTPGDDEAYDAAVAKRRGELGKHFANYVNGAARGSSAGEFAHASPVDTRVIVSYFPRGTREDARDGRDKHATDWNADRSKRVVSTERTCAKRIT